MNLILEYFIFLIEYGWLCLQFESFRKITIYHIYNNNLVFTNYLKNLKPKAT